MTILLALLDLLLKVANEAPKSPDQAAAPETEKP